MGELLRLELVGWGLLRLLGLLGLLLKLVLLELAVWGLLGLLGLALARLGELERSSTGLSSTPTAAIAEGCTVDSGVLGPFGSTARGT